MSDAHKILITLDLSKIDKDRIVPREYTNRDGYAVKSKDYRIEVVPLREEEVVKSGNGWQMVKTHFVVEAVSEEERKKGAKGKSLGNGIIFRSTKDTETAGDDW